MINEQKVKHPGASEKTARYIGRRNPLEKPAQPATSDNADRCILTKS